MLIQNSKETLISFVDLIHIIVKSIVQVSHPLVRRWMQKFSQVRGLYPQGLLSFLKFLKMSSSQKGTKAPDKIILWTFLNKFELHMLLAYSLSINRSQKEILQFPVQIEHCMVYKSFASNPRTQSSWETRWFCCKPWNSNDSTFEFLKRRGHKVPSILLSAVIIKCVILCVKRVLFIWSKSSVLLNLFCFKSARFKSK